MQVKNFVFEELQKYVHGFENIEPYKSHESDSDTRWCVTTNGYYCFKGDSLYYDGTDEVFLFAVELKNVCHIFYMVRVKNMKRFLKEILPSLWQ